MSFVWGASYEPMTLDALQKHITKENVDAGVNTALMRAIWRGKTDCVRWLVQTMGANVEKAMANIHYLPDNVEITGIICAAGMDQRRRDRGLLSALDYDNKNAGHFIRMLVAYGAKIEPSRLSMHNDRLAHLQITRALAAHAACRSAAIAVLGVGNRIYARDVLTMVAQLVWQSRMYEGWEEYDEYIF